MADSGTLQGFLEKKGGTLKSWRKRWFCLKGLKLQYSLGQQDLQPLGEISLLEITSVKEGSGLTFVLETRNRDYLLRAAHQLDRDHWVSELQALIQKVGSASPAAGAIAEQVGGGTSKAPRKASLANMLWRRSTSKADGGADGDTESNIDGSTTSSVVCDGEIVSSSATPGSNRASSGDEGGGDSLAGTASNTAGHNSDHEGEGSERSPSTTAAAATTTTDARAAAVANGGNSAATAEQCGEDEGEKQAARAEDDVFDEDALESRDRAGNLAGSPTRDSDGDTDDDVFRPRANSEILDDTPLRAAVTFPLPQNNKRSSLKGGTTQKAETEDYPAPARRFAPDDAARRTKTNEHNDTPSPPIILERTERERLEREAERERALKLLELEKREKIRRNRASRERREAAEEEHARLMEEREARALKREEFVKVKEEEITRTESERQLEEARRKYLEEEARKAKAEAERVIRAQRQEERDREKMEREKERAAREEERARLHKEREMELEEERRQREAQARELERQKNALEKREETLNQKRSAEALAKMQQQEATEADLHIDRQQRVSQDDMRIVKTVAQLRQVLEQTEHQPSLFLSGIILERVAGGATENTSWDGYWQLKPSGVTAIGPRSAPSYFETQIEMVQQQLDVAVAENNESQILALKTKLQELLSDSPTSEVVALPGGISVRLRNLVWELVAVEGSAAVALALAQQPTGPSSPRMSSGSEGSASDSSTQGHNSTHFPGLPNVHLPHMPQLPHVHMPALPHIPAMPSLRIGKKAEASLLSSSSYSQQQQSTTPSASAPLAPSTPAAAAAAATLSPGANTTTAAAAAAAADAPKAALATSSTPAASASSSSSSASVSASAATPPPAPSHSHATRPALAGPVSTTPQPSASAVMAGRLGGLLTVKKTTALMQNKMKAMSAAVDKAVHVIDEKVHALDAKVLGSDFIPLNQTNRTPVISASTTPARNSANSSPDNSSSGNTSFGNPAPPPRELLLAGFKECPAFFVNLRAAVLAVRRALFSPVIGTACNISTNVAVEDAVRGPLCTCLSFFFATGVTKLRVARGGMARAHVWTMVEEFVKKGALATREGGIVALGYRTITSNVALSRDANMCFRALICHTLNHGVLADFVVAYSCDAPVMRHYAPAAPFRDAVLVAELASCLKQLFSSEPPPPPPPPAQPPLPAPPPSSTSTSGVAAAGAAAGGAVAAEAGGLLRAALAAGQAAAAVGPSASVGGSDLGDGSGGGAGGDGSGGGAGPASSGDGAATSCTGVDFNAIADADAVVASADARVGSDVAPVDGAAASDAAEAAAAAHTRAASDATANKERPNTSADNDGDRHSTAAAAAAAAAAELASDEAVDSAGASTTSTPVTRGSRDDDDDDAGALVASARAPGVARGRAATTAAAAAAEARQAAAMTQGKAPTFALRVDWEMVVRAAAMAARASAPGKTGPA